MSIGCVVVGVEIVMKFIKFKTHPYKGGKEDPNNITAFKAFLNQLCDLAPLNLKDLLQNTYRLNTEWEED